MPGGEPTDRMALSRRYAAGAGGSRGLLITVLGAFVLPGGRPVPTSAFIDVLGRLGVEQKASRQTLMRLASEGWLRSQRDGRYTYWQLGPSAEQFLTQGTERIFGFSAHQLDWDRRWLVVLSRTPDTNTSGRRLLRTRLKWMGFGSPSPGLWISTHVAWIKDVERLVDEAGAQDHTQVFLSECVVAGDLKAMVRQAWDLDQVERAYQGFLTAFARQPSPDPLVRLARLVHAWRRFPLMDPALPVELLPQRWSGLVATRLFHRQWNKWKPAAMGEWRHISGGHTPRPGDG
jgi:phenylacetic acid degradation operon negative regulatory protein